MGVKLFDSELKIMEILWNEGDKPAREIAAKLAERVGWSKTTTYTVIKKCLDKGAITKSEPGFICSPIISKDETRELETAELVNKLYSGKPDQLIASLLGRETMSAQEIEKLRRFVREMR